MMLTLKATTILEPLFEWLFKAGTLLNRRKRNVLPVRGKVEVHVLITSGQIVGTTYDFHPPIVRGSD